MPIEARGPGGRAAYLGIDFDLLTMADILAALSRVTAESPYGYVVTPNVDHIVRLEAAGRDVRAAYDEADLRLCDSRILAILARGAGIDLPLVPGSELTARLFREVIGPGDVIAVVGADGALIERMRALHPQVAFRHHEPPMGMRHDEAAMEAAAAFVAGSGARFAFLAVGSPQQELLAQRIRSRAGAGGWALCIGAGLEFASGQRKRAPRVLQRLGLEWSYRLAQDPRRLWRRYLIDGPRIFAIHRRWVHERRITNAGLSQGGTGRGVEP